MGKNKFVLLALVSAFLSMGVMGCGGDSDSSNQQPGSAAGGSNGSAPQTFSAACSNPIPLDVPGQQVSQAGHVWQPSMYQLSELSLYVAEKTTNSSFSADANASTGFNVRMGCKEVSNTQSMNGTFNTVKWFNGVTKQHSSDSSVLDVSFTDGNLTTSQVESGEADSSASSLGDQSTSVDNQSIVDDQGDVMLVSYRVYNPSPNQVEMRIKFETNSLVEYGRAVFVTSGQ